MAENNDVKRASLALFKYSSQHITTGDENAVKTRRLLNSMFYRLHGPKEGTLILSGSEGEGLEFKDSDRDAMVVMHELNVCSNPYDLECRDKNKLNFCIEMENAKPGFAHFICIRPLILVSHCTPIDYDYYISSVDVKTDTPLEFNHVHGPCVTDKHGLLDYAISLHSRKWICCALDWIKRANMAWPDFSMKQTIVEHGVLFVPIGNTVHNYEDINWRISFSVAEKILITSFSHTQLVCYALCKCLLKDIIDKDENCRGLLCSYHLKTIIFWISEEEILALWSPENLITCFLKCLQRLIYCVQIRSCPNYFLPEVDLFNKIGKREQIALLEKLNLLLSQGWRCLLASAKLKGFKVSSTTTNIDETNYVNYFSHLIGSKSLISRDRVYAGFEKNYCKPIYNVLQCKSNRIKQLHLYSLIDIRQCLYNDIDFMKIKENKVYYIKHKMLIGYILQSLSADATTGWISLALFFQKTKQFHKALYMLSYILTKFTRDKIYKSTKEPIRISNSHKNWMLSKTMQRRGIIHAIKTKCIEPLHYSENLLPEEIEGIHSTGCQSIQFPPLVLVHVLRILCQIKLNNYVEALRAFDDLGLTIARKSFILGPCDQNISSYLYRISRGLLI